MHAAQPTNATHKPPPLRDGISGALTKNLSAVPAATAVAIQRGRPAGWRLLSPTARYEMGLGLRRAMPMLTAYLPVGFTFGVAALGIGMSKVNTMLMASMVFAASSQLLAIQLLSADASILTVVASVFVVNLRHLLMSSALAPYLRHYRKAEIAAFSFYLCDESFALHTAGFRDDKPSRLQVFTINVGLYVASLSGTCLALLTDASPATMRALGLDYAPVAMFIALLVLLVKDRTQLVVAGFCGMAAVGLAQTSVGSWNIVIATVAGATLGALGDLWTNKKSSSPSSV